MEADTKQIDCPEHPRAHKATLFCQGHRYAGTWECPTGLSDSHDHSAHYEVESVEDWPTGPNDNPQPYDVYVCGGELGCGVTIPFDEADPAVDRAEAMAE